MKGLMLLLCFFFTCKNLVAQSDTVSFSINLQQYDSISKIKLRDLYREEQTKLNDPLSSMLISKRYALEDIKTVSIPIFALNEKAKTYMCSDNPEQLISFKHDPYYQFVLILHNRKIVRTMDITDTYVKRRDSLHDSKYPKLYGTPVFTGDDNILENIPEYMCQDHGALVFMIENLEGFWVIKNGRLIKLTSGLLKRVKEENASNMFCKYGEEYIRDIATTYSFRIGYSYALCACPERRCKEVYIQMNKTNPGH